MAEKSPAGEMIELAGSCAQLGRMNLTGGHADPGSWAQLGRVNLAGGQVELAGSCAQLRRENLAGGHADPGSCAQLGRVNQAGPVELAGSCAQLGRVNPAELAGSWAQLGRVNLAGGHADLVETVITLEEQLQTFFASMDVLTADVTSLRKGCPINSLLILTYLYKSILICRWLCARKFRC
jgi:hypothetical protein